MEMEELYRLFLQCDGISTDTRKITPGSIFFSLKGEHFNANQFASQALEQGCAYAVIDEKEFAVSDKCILVNDVLKTLQQLANYHRRQFNIPVIGITGSNGKTTSKELIGAVLSTTYNILITEGNLNNHLGVPFTLLRLNMDHEMAIIEMGASKPGDIQELCEIAEPTHGIITNIGAAHIEGFGSLDGVIKTKTELYRFLKNTKGTIFYNATDDVLCKHLPADTNCIAFGNETGLVSGEITALTPYVNFKWKSDNYSSPEILTHLVGNYNFYNFLSAVCIGKFFEVDAEKINTALASYMPSNKRSQIEKTERNTLIVDCYNANATSMKAAIENFLAIDHQSKLAILGDMLELGPISRDEHQKIVDLLKNKNCEVMVVGNEFENTQTNFLKYKSAQELIQSGKLEKFTNYLILIKGSRGIKLESVLLLL
ncbi:MAG: UDP-N-acetylmuramoyl-tripeptide--D-alanyl-D-alanine ligase [Crocinitomicaceae bacterium]|nr:UDP-N-acetylmuramoyl-tripeptide--D-alanyl-D-alanine ligase [Crocinitomicaceae bacterium]